MAAYMKPPYKALKEDEPAPPMPRNQQIQTCDVLDLNEEHELFDVDDPNTSWIKQEGDVNEDGEIEGGKTEKLIDKDTN